MAPGIVVGRASSSGVCRAAGGRKATDGMLMSVKLGPPRACASHEGDPSSPLLRRDSGCPNIFTVTGSYRDAQEAMTERERFRRLMRGDAVDRPPLLEEGVRKAVLRQWHGEGLPPGSTHVTLFGLTPHENIGPDLTYADRHFGHLFALLAREYRRAFNVSRRRFPHDWLRTVERLEHREHIVCVSASRGLFQALGVGDWPTLEQVLLATLERPASVRDRLEMYGDFCARMLDLTLEDVDPEFIHLSEPISDNTGPLISPTMFSEFMLPVYERIIAVARRHGCNNILVTTYGNSARLFPAMIKAGVTMLWLAEAPDVPELDYRALRSQFGPTLGLIGGIPLDILRDAPIERIAERLEAIVPPLLSEGRYVPLAGGRVRAGVSWAAYRRYREVLAKMMGGSTVGRLGG